MSNIKRNLLKPLLIGIVLTLCYAIVNMFHIYLLYYLNALSGLFFVFSVIVLFFFFGYSRDKILKEKQKGYYLVLISGLICIYILAFKPFIHVGIDLEFSMHEKERMKLVEMFENGQIEHYENQLYQELPDKYKYLSKSDDGIVIKYINGEKYVFFFTARGWWKVYPVIVYTTANSSKDFDKIDLALTNSKKIKDHWYYANINNRN